WALESPGEARFLGFVGLAAPRFDAPFTPCIEIGWRLARRFWGKGYASEAARGALEHGFGELGLREIVSFTTVGNAASRRVMERIGMRSVGEIQSRGTVEGEDDLREDAPFAVCVMLEHDR
ncbi:MAG: N-acetyltransferase, partial [Actinobacteria bacterium]